MMTDREERELRAEILRLRAGLQRVVDCKDTIARSAIREYCSDVLANVPAPHEASGVQTEVAMNRVAFMTACASVDVSTMPAIASTRCFGEVAITILDEDSMNRLWDAVASSLSSAMAEHFCKFCGEITDTPCVDETDLHIYSRSVDRCSDASFNHEAERHFEASAVSSTERDALAPERDK